MTRVLYVHSRDNTFIRIDREALRERFELLDYHQPSFWPRPLELIRKLRQTDVVFGWFASWHTFLALILAKLWRRPSVLVIGGFDTAAMPQIGYGSQRGGIRRWIVRRTVSMASRLITNSRYSLEEIRRNLEHQANRVAVIHHGVPDRFPDREHAAEHRRIALTVGAVYSLNLERKGHRPFVRAARKLPDVEFVIAGKWWDGAIEELRREAGPNVRFTGYLQDDELDAEFRRAGVYVQASLHEGFGLSLAEAMLAGCVPVVTDAGALPEVVGDTGVTIGDPSPEEVARGIRRALQLGPDEGLRARARVRELFPYEMRRDGICAEVERALTEE